MRSLFRAFEVARVRYLVISGQASVLYGAALFSQDLDLWIDPTGRNLAAMLRALARRRARFHKLTPRPTVPLLRRGHGFHFVVPSAPGSEIYLDVMGQPPRVGRFEAAFLRSRRMLTAWGRLPVVAIEDLVEIKKTNRPADYEVITRLALIRLREEPSPRPPLLRWALENVFRVEELWETLLTFADILGPRVLTGFPAARLLYAVHARGREPSLSVLSRAAALLAREAQRLQDRGRAYWRPRIRELRRLRSEGGLVSPGTAVWPPDTCNKTTR